VAAAVALDAAGKVTEARIVPGAAFPVWARVPEAEALLLGGQPTHAALAAAGREAAGVMVLRTGRRWSTEYKEPVVAALARRALEACCAGPAGGAS
jgi:carbon-monoxide dehydrogenase medium subunit/xanthine dehydrogenase FAD-binding subunit